MDTTLPATFNKGEIVPEDGTYVCSPCGYHHAFQKDEQFTECLSCLSGTPDGHEEFVEGMELWEKTDPNYEKVVEEAERGQS